jgi:hypothetical protein
MATVSSGYVSSAPVIVTNPLVWKFISPENSSIVFTSAKVRQPLQQEITEQQGVFRPLGNSKAVVVSGSMYGVDGTYEITSVGETEWASLYAVLTFQGALIVLDPIGRQKYVRFTTRNWTESGIITNLLRLVKVQYVEVSAP